MLVCVSSPSKAVGSALPCCVPWVMWGGGAAAGVLGGRIKVLGKAAPQKSLESVEVTSSWMAQRGRGAGG